MKKILIGLCALVLFAGGFAYAKTMWSVVDSFKTTDGSLTYQKTYDQATNTICYSVIADNFKFSENPSVSISCVVIR